MLDAWKDCEVLNTHEGQIICRGHPRPRTRTFSADRFPQALCRKAPRTRAEGQIICQAEHAAGADLLSWPRGGLCARLNTHKGQVYCHLEQVRRGRQQGGDGPLNTHEHARSIPHEHARLTR